jgi:hypothetical protein
MDYPWVVKDPHPRGEAGVFESLVAKAGFCEVVE